MLISQVVNDGFKTVFTTCDQAAREKQIKAIHYIQSLAAMTNAPVHDWDLFETFGNGPGAIYVEKKSLNKLFFEKLAQATPETNKDAIEINKVLASNVQKVLGVVKKQLSDTVLNSYNNSIYSATNYYNSYLTRLRDAHTYYMKHLAIQGNTTELETEVEKCLQNNFWQFLPNTPGLDGKLEFVTRNDIVLSYKNPSAGVDCVVNFGKLRAIFFFQPLELVVRKESNNLVYDGIQRHYYHPHISENGQVCWGNVSTAATEALTKLKLATVLDYLAAVLTLYNPGNPYIAIETFASYQAKTTRINIVRCATCQQDVEDCRCVTCGVCSTATPYGESVRCQCCQECGGREGNCSCFVCSVCGDRSAYGPHCDCCQDCENSSDNCTCPREDF